MTRFYTRLVSVQEIAHSVETFQDFKNPKFELLLIITGASQYLWLRPQQNRNANRTVPCYGNIKTVYSYKLI